MSDLIYVANLDDKQVLAALKRIDQGFTNSGKTGDKAFGSIGKSASTSGVQIGAMAGIAASVTSEFINLGKQAVDVLVSIGQQSVQTAIEIDTLKTKLLGMFDGNKEAANETFNFIQERSRELGIDLSALASAFIPKSESLAQFERIAKIATVLATQDPLGEEAARIALQETLSGDFVSLRKRFEFVDKQDIENIKEAQKELGVTEGTIQELEKILSRQGLSFDNLAETAGVAFARLDETARQLGGRLGEPIVASLEAATNKILDFTEANGDELIIFADTIGRAIADVIDFLSGIDFEGLDVSDLQAVADYIFRIVNALQLATGQIAMFTQSFSGSGELLAGVTMLDELWSGLTRLDEALLTLSQIFALVNASLAAFSAAGDKAAAVGNTLAAVGNVITGNYLGAWQSINKAADAISEDDAAMTAYRESLLASNKMMEDYKASLEGNADAQARLAAELENTKNAGTGAADAILETNAANKEAEESAAALSEAQAKVNEKMAEAEKDFQQKLEDIDLNAERKRLDTQIEFAQKREDAARDNLEKIADLYRQNEQDIQDAQTDLSRKEEDITRKYNNERIDLEKEQRQKRVDIEKSFREQLQDIQRKFNEDADEAEQNRDAIAYLKAVKQRDQAVGEAQQERTTSIEELQIEGQQRAEELATQRQREMEEAQIDNERKMEDLRLNLERQIEEQNIAYERQLADIRLNEERKNEELRVARERDIEDAKTAYARKLEDLQTALAAELALIQEHAAAVAAAQATTGGSGSTRPNRPVASSGGAANASTNSGSGTVMQMDSGFATGGYVGAGNTVLVGEQGPELVKFPASGNVMNSQRTASIINQQKTDMSKNFNMGMLDPGAIDSLLASKIRNILFNELASI